MPTISEITSGNQYTGNAALGGFGGGAIDVDTKPVEQLGVYTMLYNKAKYDQRQKDTQSKIDDLSKLTSLDLNQIDPKDKDQVLAAYNDFYKTSQDYASKIPANDQEKVSQYLDWQKGYKNLTNLVSAANVRYIGIAKRKADIAAETDPSTKDQMTASLTKDINDTDIYTPVPPENKFDVSVPQPSKPVVSTAQVLYNTGNSVITIGHSYFNSKANLTSSDADSFGLNEKYIKEGTPEWDALSPLEQQQQKMLPTSYIGKWQDAEDVFNKALSDPKYKDKDGNIDYNAIKSSNSILGGINDLEDRFNAYNVQKIQEIKQGYFTDQLTGRKVSLPPNMNPSDFFTIDKSKPLSASQLILLQKFQIAAPDVITKEFKYTGEANALRNIQDDYAASIYASNKAHPDVINKPEELGNLIYQVNSSGILNADGKPVPGAKMIRGVIVDSKGQPLSNASGEYQVPISSIDNSVITEFAKYAGDPKVAQSGVAADGTTTARIKSNDKNLVTIRIDDSGEISGIQTTDGSFAGVDQFKYITNQSSYKGVTKYKPAQDVSGGVKPVGNNKSSVPIPKGAKIGN